MISDSIFGKALFRTNNDQCPGCWAELEGTNTFGEIVRGEPLRFCSIRCRARWNGEYGEQIATDKLLQCSQCPKKVDGLAGYFVGGIDHKTQFVCSAACRHIFLSKLDAELEKDNVHSPKHYTSHKSGVECIEITEHMNFCLGNAVKYIWRADLKHSDNGVEDLKKAKFYIERELGNRAMKEKKKCP